VRKLAKDMTPDEWKAKPEKRVGQREAAKNRMLFNGNRLDIIEQGRRMWSKPIFMETMMVGAWNIWKERNQMLFEGIVPSVNSWKARFKSAFKLLVHRTKDKYHPFISEVVENC
jgi:hypothetical protein